ncbi:hypothetical protein FBU30_001810, partial [Linnemannia zychae]
IEDWEGFGDGLSQPRGSPSSPEAYIDRPSTILRKRRAEIDPLDILFSRLITAYAEEQTEHAIVHTLEHPCIERAEANKRLKWIREDIADVYRTIHLHQQSRPRAVDPNIIAVCQAICSVSPMGRKVPEHEDNPSKQ